MNIEKNFLLVCENVILDDKNKLSLIGTFNAINVLKLPAAHNLFVVANLGIKEVKKPTNIKLKVEVVAPTGKQIVQNPPVIEKELEVKDAVQNVGGIFEMRNMVFAEIGIYEINLIVNEKQIGVFPLEIRKVIPPNVA